MMGAAALSWLVGLALLAGLIGYQGASDVVTALGLVGWGALLLGLAHLCTLLADTLGWRALLRRPARPALPMLLLGRWVGMSVNGLLPVAQVGGEWVRAGLLRRAGVPGPVAGASVVIDLTIGVVTQVAFVALGLALLAARPDQGAGISELIIGIGLLGVMAASFGILQQRGLFGWSGRLLERLGRHGAGRASRETHSLSTRRSGDVTGDFAPSRSAPAGACSRG